MNKELLVENIEEDTTVAQELWRDSSCGHGHIKEDTGYVRQSHSAYISAQQVKKEKQSAEDEHASEARKRKAMVASLQQQKRQKLAELKAEAAAIDSKIASIESGNLPH